jgi:alkylated DNA repair dioxygenase AlkB
MSQSFSRHFISEEKADDLFAFLETLNFKRRVNPRNHKQYLKRGTLTYQDLNAAAGDVKTAGNEDVELLDLATAPKEIQYVRERLTEWEGRPVNYISINRYPDGSAGIGWHNHKEDLAINTPVFLISVGASRTLWFREIGSDEAHGQLMEHGDMITMPAAMNATHQHAVLPEKGVGLRYSLNCKCLPTK